MKVSFQWGVALFNGSAEVRVGICTLTGGYFRDALPDQEDCLVHPRYDGYVPLQEEAGAFLRNYSRGESPADRVWEEIDRFYRRSRRSGQ